MATVTKNVEVELDGWTKIITLEIEYEDGKPNTHGDGWREETAPVVTSIEALSDD